MKELNLSELTNVNGGGWKEGYEIGNSETGEQWGRAFAAALSIIGGILLIRRPILI